jgi:Protein of unknown function (DUF3822)
LPAENQTVRATFTINTADSATVPHLFISVGVHGISFTELAAEENTFLSLVIYPFAPSLAEAEMVAALNTVLNTEKLLEKEFKQVDVIWCFNESILVPNEYFDRDASKNMLALVYGDSLKRSIKNEMVLKHTIRNVYQLPTAIENSINVKFPYCKQVHQSSLLINFEADKKDLLYCHFNIDVLTVLLRKEGQLQVIQSFDFATPEDAAYQLLRVCQSFNVEASAITLLLSGMVDINSALYQELYKYFTVVHFYNFPPHFNYTNEIKNYPEHYFSHLFATAACVL